MEQNTLLQHAARNGHIAVVDLLLAIPAVEKLESQSGSALMSALTHNQTAVVKLLIKVIDLTANDTLSSRFFERQRLQALANNGQSECLYLLVKAKWPNGLRDMSKDFKDMADLSGKSMITHVQEEAKKASGVLDVMG